MQPSAKTGKAHRPAAESAGPTDESPTNTGAHALRERLVSAVARQQDNDTAATARRLAKLREVVRRFDALPVLDSREPDEIIGYDENGLPT